MGPDLPIFRWTPDYGAGVSVTPTILTSQYGDGYSQDTPEGINFMPQIWSVSFNKEPGFADEIYDFLIALGGYQRFWWTPPRRELAIKCKTSGEIKKDETDAGQTTISTKFQQVFDPD